MANHRVTIQWRKTQDQTEHYMWRFDNGVELHANPGHDTLKENMIDPESAFVASLSSCHMLSFMAEAVKSGFSVKHYRDNAVGVLTQNAQGKIAISKVLLQPEIDFDGDMTPSGEQISQLHDTAHQNCFIANSVLAEIQIDPVLTSVEA